MIESKQRTHWVWCEARLKHEFSKFGEIVSATISIGMRKKLQLKKSNALNADKPASPLTKDDESPDKPQEQKDAGSVTKETADSKKDKKEEPKDKKAEKDPVEEELWSLGFGFVDYATHEAAVEAVKQMND